MEEQYRELEHGEDIQPGDQFLRSSGEWVELTERDLQAFEFRRTVFLYNKGKDLKTRRRINDGE